MHEHAHEIRPHRNSDEILLFFLLFSVVLVGTSLLLGPIETLLPNLAKILLSPHQLLTDACAVGGVNGAWLNAGLIGVITCGVFALARVELSGLHIATYFHSIGIAFFGKNCMNIWPLMAGVYLYCLVKREPFKKYAHFALFAGALSPFVSEMLFSYYVPIPLYVSIPLALVLGTGAGFLIVPLSAHTLSMHKGYNLYNAGLSAGLIAFVLFSIYRTVALTPLGADAEFVLCSTLYYGRLPFIPVFFGALFVACVIAGFAANGFSFRGYGKLLATTGYREDYVTEFGLPCVLINFGLLGLAAIACVVAAGAPLSGLTVGSILCLVCWCGLGTTPRNMLPILAGYALVSLVAEWRLSDQVICIGACFATGLSPITGRYGPVAGLIAGALHACCVSYTAAFHGGFNIFNGGFTAGLVAIVLVPVLHALVKPRGNPVR